MVNLRVNVVERDSQQFVEGVIRPVREDDKVLWSHWHGALEAGAEDGHWAWDDLMDQAFADPDQFVVYALEAFGELQGLRMIQISQNEVEEYGIHAHTSVDSPVESTTNGPLSGGGEFTRRHRDFAEPGRRARRSHPLRVAPRGRGISPQERYDVFCGPSIEGLARYRFTSAAANSFLKRLRIKGLLPWPT